MEDAMKIWGNPENYRITQIQKLGERVISCFSNNGILAFAGNGGSAAESSHLAAEFIGKCVKSHKPWPAINLSESISSLTAVTNDYGFEETFVRSSQALLNSNSVIIALSTSGTSANILKLIEDARARGIYSVLWTSEKHCSTLNSLADEVWRAPTNSTPRAQELHLFWGHALAEYIESHI